ncbi:CaiB/BaiF CoA-transferase family protein [Labrenzia sp. PHM005]|uniref:CaiB/BaiF CoA transferase family protein n=1 Tax=Labrenzia sp. PHM005 TaxID=2590016 RepID=UPI0011402943|nr:CoA transferase [Labrenzia sp. PHM005]QDG74889.1 CoA transferase [Labrenzia sp. PHM005]
MGPLKGIRVVDMSAVLAGPVATQMLGDFGADVIKIEPPQGDLLRQVGPMRSTAMGPLYMNANYNKRSVCLDLKSVDGREVLIDLIRSADIFVTNSRPKAMMRLGLSYDTVQAIKPNIIYTALLGFGETGRYAGKPAYDDLIQGAVGLPYLQSKASGGVPRYFPNAIADRAFGLTAANAILAALVHRERTGEGQQIDIPMFETVAQFVLGDHLGGLSFDPPLDEGGYHRLTSKARRPFRTKDGYICLLLYSDAQWSKFLEVTNRPTRLAGDNRFSSFAGRQEHFEDLCRAIGDVIKMRTSAEWLALLDKADIPVMPMHSLETLLEDPHLQDVGFFETYDHPSEGRMRRTKVPVSWSQTPSENHQPPPVIGEHTVEVLKETGLSDDTIYELLQSGAASAPALEPIPA